MSLLISLIRVSAASSRRRFDVALRKRLANRAIYVIINIIKRSGHSASAIYARR